MSRKLTPHYPDAKSSILTGFSGKILLAEGATVPSDGAAGYAPGCLFFKRAAAALVGAYRNDGTETSADFNLVNGGIDLSTLTATAAELNRLDDDNAVLATLAGTGITGGTGTVYKTSVIKVGSIYQTKIYIDLTGLGSSTTDLDIIGTGATAAHIGQITAARCGTIEAIRMTCLELPAGGVTDIDLYSATEATGVFDAGIGTLTATALITSGGAWASGTTKGSTAVPAANGYLYLTCGAGAVPGTYTAGKFLIELFGY